MAKIQSLPGKVRLLFIIVLSSIIHGCDESILSDATGKNGELIVVVDTSLWNGEVGKLIRDSISPDFPGLPQNEPLFRLIQVESSEFKSILRSHRNVLIISESDSVGELNYNISETRNKWSKGQLVINLFGTDESWLQAAVLNFATSIREKFYLEDRQRMINGYSSLSDPLLNNELESELSVRMPLTHDFFIATKKENYCWIRRETEYVSIGVQIYRLPYDSDSLFNESKIIHIRDSVSKLNIPGPSAGSYMITESRFQPVVDYDRVADCYTKVLRGLWKTENDFMGGPFALYSVLDEKKQEVIFIDVFLYSPKFDKKDYMRQMDAVVYGLSLK